MPNTESHLIECLPNGVQKRALARCEPFELVFSAERQALADTPALSALLQRNQMVRVRGRRPTRARVIQIPFRHRAFDFRACALTAYSSANPSKDVP